MAGVDEQKEKENVTKVRELFWKKHQADHEKGVYDERDMGQVDADDEYIASFIRTFETLQDAADHLHDSLKFRKDFEVNDLTPEMFPLEFWENGGVYFHSTDKDGLKILYLQVKVHKKDADLARPIRQFLAYFLEKQHTEHPYEPIVVLFDLTGCGLSVLDMDFIKFIICCFKMYYPKMLGYMLMYDMPWLFNAAWKVIKAMLHAESVKRIKFVTKADIQAYIDRDQLWQHMGGTDTFVYKYEPDMLDAGDENEAEIDQNGAARKKVTFADEDNGDNVDEGSLSNDSIKELENQPPSKPTGSILGSRRGPLPAPTKKRVSKDDNSFIGRLLTISPAEELEFVIEDTTKEACDTILLKNTLPYPIAFKVKTTSPEKYRVRPSSGMVKPGTNVEVVIHLQNGFQNTVHKDKFLIMAMEVTNDSNTSFAELWKNVQKDSIMEHRLRCVRTLAKEKLALEDGTGAGNSNLVLKELAAKVDTLVECNRRLNKAVTILIILQFVFLFILLVGIAVWYFWSDIAATENRWQQCKEP